MQPCPAFPSLLYMCHHAFIIKKNKKFEKIKKIK